MTMATANLTNKVPIGLRVATIAVALQMVAFLCQLYSVLNWQGAVNVGLQPDRLSGGDAAETARARLQWGNAAVDVLWYFPMTLVALVELVTGRRTLTGFAISFSVLSFGVYWPLSVTFQWDWPEYSGLILTTLLCFGVPSGLGLWGLWVNRQIFLDSHAEKRKSP